MGRMYVYPAKVGAFYARRRVVNGVRGTLLPYTTGTFRRPAVGPRGGKALRECFHQLWWVDGKVCSITNVPHETRDGAMTWQYEFRPVTATVYNRYDADEPRHRLYAGVLVETLYMGVDENGYPY